MRAGDAVEEAVQNLEEEFRADDKELCHAATKIQASFRGHMARKQTPPSKGKAEDELSKELQKLDAKQEEDELADIDLNDPDLHAAASKIQATFRKKIVPGGGKTAPQQQQEPQKTEDSRTAEQLKQDEEDIAAIDLKDPDLQKAASKIQATFRRKTPSTAKKPENPA